VLKNYNAMKNCMQNMHAECALILLHAPALRCYLTPLALNFFGSPIFGQSQREIIIDYYYYLTTRSGPVCPHPRDPLSLSVQPPATCVGLY
jgi:hypothetical protein